MILKRKLKQCIFEALMGSRRKNRINSTEYKTTLVKAWGGTFFGKLYTGIYIQVTEEICQI